ncbi:hypothetical protein ASD78_12145 [Lysobacter sp. Root667]|uniref:hypothetical protein n=1 Tax=Lysobacter sp. Root667 TaxID=1736581 RepID=UPI0006FA1540|nr:hypothetical protein [Lysobacter sp. Root667]KRA74238.1 hypothetical protein ASD78_12145 [Lysobacter sp. Root667]
MNITPDALGHFALVLAAQARVLGMEAENKHREACGNAIAYDLSAFFGEADVIEQHARQLFELGAQR